jgi:hypothetical protein
MSRPDQAFEHDADHGEANEGGGRTHIPPSLIGRA